MVGQIEEIAAFEVRLLGGLLFAPDELALARAIVRADDFESVGRGAIYDAMLRLHETGRPITLVDLAADLLEQGELERAGGRVALGALADEAVTGAWVESDAGRIAEAAADRRRGREAARIVANPRDREALERLTYVDAEGSGEEAEPSLDLRFPEEAFVGTFHVVREALAPNTGACPAHIFASTWAALSVAIGRSAWGDFNGPVIPQPYALCLGPVNDFKSSAVRAVLSILDVPRCSPASAAGLFDELVGRQALLYYADEWAELKARIEYSGGGELRTMLNDLWGAPPYLARNRSRAGKDAQKLSNRVDFPRAAVLAMGHADGFWAKNAASDLGSGFLSRFAIFIGTGGNFLRVTRAISPAALAYGTDFLSRLGLMSIGPITLAAEAEIAWGDYVEGEYARVAALEHQRSLLHRRVVAHVARLALTYAVDAGRVVVELDDIGRARLVGDYLARCADDLYGGLEPEVRPWEARAEYVEETIARILLHHPSASARDIRDLWPNRRTRPPRAMIRRVLGEIRA